MVVPSRLQDDNIWWSFPNHDAMLVMVEAMVEVNKGWAVIRAKPVIPGLCSHSPYCCSQLGVEPCVRPWFEGWSAGELVSCSLIRSSSKAWWRQCRNLDAATTSGRLEDATSCAKPCAFTRCAKLCQALCFHWLCQVVPSLVLSLVVSALES